MSHRSNTLSRFLILILFLGSILIVLNVRTARSLAQPGSGTPSSDHGSLQSPDPLPEPTNLPLDAQAAQTREAMPTDEMQRWNHSR